MHTDRDAERGRRKGTGNCRVDTGACAISARRCWKWRGGLEVAGRADGEYTSMLPAVWRSEAERSVVDSC